MLELALIGRRAVDLAKLWWKLALGILIGAVLVFPLGQCSGAKIERDRAKAASVVAILRNGDAKEGAAEQRGADAAKTAARAEGRLDAVKAIPDERPGAVRRAYNCQRLRDSGARLPAGC